MNNTLFACVCGGLLEALAGLGIPVIVSAVCCALRRFRLL